MTVLRIKSCGMLHVDNSSAYSQQYTLSLFKEKNLNLKLDVRVLLTLKSSLKNVFLQNVTIMQSSMNPTEQ